MASLSCGFFLLALMAGLRGASGRQGVRELAILRRRLQGIEQQEALFCGEARGLAAWKSLVDLRKRALFRGADPRRLTTLVCDELAEAELHAGEREQFIALLRWRWGFCLGVAAVGRYWLLCMQPAHPLRLASKPWLVIDAGLLVLALVFVLGSYTVLQGKYPWHWLWCNGFSDDALAWLRMIFLDHPGRGSEDLQRLWQQVKMQELRQGQDQAKSRQLVLYLWSKQKKMELLFRQRKFDDGLPLWDIFALGLPACCLLAAPALPFVLRL